MQHEQAEARKNEKTLRSSQRAMGKARSDALQKGVFPEPHYLREQNERKGIKKRLQKCRARSGEARTLTPSARSLSENNIFEECKEH
jgi:hypothetical protein